MKIIVALAIAFLACMLLLFISKLVLACFVIISQKQEEKREEINVSFSEELAIIFVCVTVIATYFLFL